jgi:hypothetical protein
VVDVFDDLFELLHHHCFLDDCLHCFDGFVLTAYLYYLLAFLYNLFDLFNNDGHFHNFLYDSLDVLVDIDNLGDQLLYLDYFWDLDYLLLQFLHFVDFGDGVGLIDYFLNYLLCGDDLLDNSVDGHNFLYNLFYFADGFGNDGHFFDDLFILHAVEYLLLYSLDLPNLHNSFFDDHYFL